MNEITCDFCGCSLSEDEIHYFDDRSMCEECYNERTTVCTHCHNVIWTDDDEGEEDFPLCQHCRDYYYTTCEDCGRLINLDDAMYFDDDSDYPYCQSCYERHEKRYIHDYSYKPEPIFYGDTNRYFGVELEIDNGGENDDNAKIIFDIANRENPHIYIKHDGSIDEGMELVSHPMDLNYHLTSMPWSDVMEKAISFHPANAKLPMLQNIIFSILSLLKIIKNDIIELTKKFTDIPESIKTSLLIFLPFVEIE